MFSYTALQNISDTRTREVYQELDNINAPRFRLTLFVHPTQKTA